MTSDVREPINIGSDEMVSMQEMAEMICTFEKKTLGFTYTPGPIGVRYFLFINALGCISNSNPWILAQR